MEHELKAWPEHYAAIERGAKTCELRLNDRPYAVGDTLLLREFEPLNASYTGASLRVRVTHILNGGVWLAPGYVALSIRIEGNLIISPDDETTLLRVLADDVMRWREAGGDVRDLRYVLETIDRIEQMKGTPS